MLDMILSRNQLSVVVIIQNSPFECRINLTLKTEWIYKNSIYSTNKILLKSLFDLFMYWIFFWKNDFFVFDCVNPNLSDFSPYYFRCFPTKAKKNYISQKSLAPIKVCT